MDGSADLYSISSSACSCTSQWPCQVRIFLLVCLATFIARYSSGMQSTRSDSRLSTTATAFDEVQQMSVSAFTSAEVFT